MKCLDDVYEVEPGNGVERDNYLKDRNVETYLIKQVEPQKARRRYSSRPKIWNEEDGHNKGKRSFKLGNPLSSNSSNPNTSQDEDTAVDWTPEIPFENVRVICFILYC